MSVTSDLEIERVAPSPATIDAIAGIEAVLLGHRREVDTAFILEQRPAWLARRDGVIVGFAFGARDELTGPIGVLDPADMPALLAVVENHASESGIPEIYFSTPMSNAVAVEYLLGRGYRIDPFVAAALADDLSIALDRWIHTGLSYIL